ncbi:MAG: hypothetical protein CMH52_02030 [Myxococcales bacterium]|nr:hypothetical protein [Myxococcales bacterium]|tara:strand:+ start:3376 stop:4863 length:1488 start_codon:yes stop_codon:yes gene_type:complete
MVMDTTLTLCVFVRPEGHFELSTLAFVSRLVDEVIIAFADGRNAPDSPRLSANMRLLNLTWEDDFSKARNRLLAEVKSDSLFLLEYNERLQPDQLKTIRRLAQDPSLTSEIHCFRIDVVSADGSVLESTYEPRLWHTETQAQFSGRIYERLETSSQPRFKYHDDPIIKQDFEHRTDEQEQVIGQRNIDLLEMQYIDTPADCHTRYCIGLTYMMRGEFELGLEFFSQLINEFKDSDFSRSAMVFSVECLRKLGRPQDAFEKGLDWVQSCPDYGELWFFIGRAALESNQRIKAHAAFKKAGQIPQICTPDLYRDPAVHDYRADIGCVQALASLRRADEAESLLADVRTRVPEGDLADLDHDFIDIWLQLNQPKRAFNVVEAWIEKSPEWASTALLGIVEYCFNSQGPTQAYLMYQGSIAAYESLLQFLPVVIVGAALSDMVDDHDSHFNHLQLCVQLGSTEREHYRTLIRLLVERGELDRASEITELEAKLMTEKDA